MQALVKRIMIAIACDLSHVADHGGDGLPTKRRKAAIFVLMRRGSPTHVAPEAGHTCSGRHRMKAMVIRKASDEREGERELN